MLDQLSRLTFLLRSALAAMGIISVSGTPAEARSLFRRYSSLKMQGQSMFPTLHNGEMLKIDTSAYTRKRPGRGDIVTFSYPLVTGRRMPFLVKRVVGLPGETIGVERGHVFINGHRLPEPHVVNSASYTYPTNRVPADSYFLLGDNRNNSMDSHLFGAVRLSEIAGKVIQRNIRR